MICDIECGIDIGGTLDFEIFRCYVEDSIRYLLFYTVYGLLFLAVCVAKMILWYDKRAKQLEGTVIKEKREENRRKAVEKLMKEKKEEYDWYNSQGSKEGE